MLYKEKARVGGEVHYGRQFSAVEIEKNGGVISAEMVADFHETLWQGLQQAAAEEGLILGEPRFFSHLDPATNPPRTPFAAVTATVIGKR